MRPPAPNFSGRAGSGMESGAWRVLGVWSVALSVFFGLATPAIPQPLGAIDSQSAHEPGSAEEAEEHAHGPRHDGFFGDADDLYHYEVLVEAPNRLILYVNDEFNQPLDTRQLIGRYVLAPDAETPIVGDFTPSDEGQFFVATLPAVSPNPIPVLIEVLKAGQWVGLEFSLPQPAHRQ